MRENFVFISDFDGTITKRDFYLHMMDKYLKEEGHKYYEKWRNNEIKDIEFLGCIFRNINQDEKRIYEDILEIEIDSNLKELIDFIHNNSGDFVILSAGSTYYIEILLKHSNIDNVTVYSNKAIYKDKGIYFDIDPTYEFYSERYGLDKKKVVEHLKSKYKKLYYAGDSEPDYDASLLCDLRFATGRLIPLYKKNDIDFYKFNNFNEIKNILIKEYL